MFTFKIVAACMRMKKCLEVKKYQKLCEGVGIKRTCNLELQFSFIFYLILDLAKS